MVGSKIEVKVGIVEFAGEGDQEWLAKQLDKILEKIPELLAIEISNPSALSKEPIKGVSEGGIGTKIDLSVLNIAGKLKCSSGSDLVLSAAAYMHFVENKKSFTREDILKTMKAAIGIYKDSHSSNLTGILSQLEKNGIFTKSSNTYSIQANKVTELSAILIN